MVDSFTEILLLQGCFIVNFRKMFRIVFLQNTSQQLLFKVISDLPFYFSTFVMRQKRNYNFFLDWAYYFFTPPHGLDILFIIKPHMHEIFLQRNFWRQVLFEKCLKAQTSRIPPFSS